MHLGSHTTLAQAGLTDGAGKLYAHAAGSCLIFRPSAGDRSTTTPDTGDGPGRGDVGGGVAVDQQ